METMSTESRQLDSYNIQSVSAFEEAERTGKQVVLPKPNQLFIDIDNEASFTLFTAQLGRLRQYEYASLQVTPSASGLPNRHIVVGLNRDLTDTERIAFQAAMGSDPIRELLGLIRVSHGDQYPTLFLEATGATPATVPDNSVIETSPTKDTNPSTDSNTMTETPF
jgi:hypothetical protein